MPACAQPERRLLPNGVNLALGDERKLQRDLGGEQRRAALRPPDLAVGAATECADEGVGTDGIVCPKHLFLTSVPRRDDLARSSPCREFCKRRDFCWW